ncbi:hypothetical protein PsB1_0592 [Candidatus Phycosocius spiralis]|uniref:LPS export ABC transporter periplasmic protein LptC n=1 Tax=Candidatus Phycosocius spiralis TaxID=2815099 RepID=A0ABQ4PUQ5_9PROT|nr:hypothetical protein PsB1_0592 [Candidatus Phycosocius spiralis]
MRQRLTPQAARRRSIRVKAIRMIFLAGAGLSTLLLVGSVVLRGVQSAGIDTSKLVQDNQFVIENPQFIGTTKEGKRLKVTGRRALRSVKDPNGVVRLEKPRIETADESTLTANQGIWSQTQQKVTLEGDVVFSRKSGEKARGATATWTSNPSLLTLEGGIEVTFSDGEKAIAQTLQWYEAQRQFILIGQAMIELKGGQAISDRAIYDQDAKTVIGIGNTSIRSDRGLSYADRYEYLTTTKRLTLSGNVRAKMN